MEERTHFPDQRLGAGGGIVFRLERLHRDLQRFQLANDVIGTDIAVVQDQRRMEGKNAFGAESSVISNGGELGDLRRISARIVDADEARLRSERVNHLVVGLTDAKDALAADEIGGLRSEAVAARQKAQKDGGCRGSSSDHRSDHGKPQHTKRRRPGAFD